MTKTEEMVSRSRFYSRQGIETKEAKAQYNYHSLRLELKRKEERGAELASQAFKYVANGKLKDHLGDISDREREIAIAIVKYVLYGNTSYSGLIKERMDNE